MLSLGCRLSPLPETCLLSLADLHQYLIVQVSVEQLQAGGTDNILLHSILLADE